MCTTTEERILELLEEIRDLLKRKDIVLRDPVKKVWDPEISKIGDDPQWMNTYKIT